MKTSDSGPAKAWCERKRIWCFVGGVMLLALSCFIEPIMKRVHGHSAQEHAGRQYMDSLSSNDIQAWMKRSEHLMAGSKVTNTMDVYGIAGKPVPDDLKKLKIIEVDILPDRVDYKWCGGMNDTALIIEQGNNGQLKVTAKYDDEHSRVLWPNGD